MKSFEHYHKVTVRHIITFNSADKSEEAYATVFQHLPKKEGFETNIDLILRLERKGRAYNDTLSLSRHYLEDKEIDIKKALELVVDCYHDNANSFLKLDCISAFDRIYYKTSKDVERRFDDYRIRYEQCLIEDDYKNRKILWRKKVGNESNTIDYKNFYYDDIDGKPLFKQRVTEKQPVNEAPIMPMKDAFNYFNEDSSSFKQNILFFLKGGLR